MLCKICRKKINSYMAIECICVESKVCRMCISCSNTHYCNKDIVVKKNKELLVSSLTKIIAEKVAKI